MKTVATHDPNDPFHEGLKAQYRDLIHEAILECESEHRTRLNIHKLNTKLQLILKAAHYDGLAESEVSILIDQALPGTANKAAA